MDQITGPDQTPAEEAGTLPNPPRGHRRRNTWITVAVVAVVALVVFGLLGYQAFTKRLAAARQLDEATALVEQGDIIVVQVDGVIREKVTPELAESARGAQRQVPEAATQLERAVKLIETGYSDLTEDEQRRANLLKAAANARLAMLAVAPEVLEFNVKAAESLTSARDAWDKVLAADKLSDQAVAAYNKLTKASVGDSSKLNKGAAEQLMASRSGFAEAERAFPEVPFETYVAYIDTRIRLNKLSQQSDAAWLAGQLVKANSLISSYNAEDKKAVAQAALLPTSPEAAIATAYENAVKESTDAYYLARDKATKADDKLRNF